MMRTELYRLERLQINRYAMLLGLIWTLSISLSLAWNISTCQHDVIDIPLVITNSLGHASLWLLGLFGLIWGIRNIQRQLQERTRIFEELQKNEARFAATFEQAAVGIVHAALDGHFIRINQKMCDIVGYNRAELLEQNFKTITYAADLEADLAHVEKLLRKEIPNFALEKRYIHKQGHLVWIHLTVSLVRSPSGEPDYFIGVIEDITPRKLAEEELRQQEAQFRFIAENTSDMIWIMDMSETFSYVSPSVLKLRGYTPAEVCKQSLAEVLTPESLPTGRAVLNDALARIRQGNRDVPCGPYELAQPCRNGSIVITEVMVNTLFDDAGQFKCFLGVSRDITERKRLEENLRQAEKMQAIGQLAGGIAHDFNNQLGGILGYTEMTRIEVATEPQLVRYLDNIITSVNRSRDLTAKLLAFARKGKFQSIPLDLHAIIDEVIALLERSIDKKIEMIRNFQAKNATIEGDPTQIQNAILNLALNARDAMPAGGEITFQTSLQPFDHDRCNQLGGGVNPGMYLEVRVRDTGCGMDEETMQHLFEPFFTTKEEGKGTGLGLAAVYGTTKSHHGSIQVESHPGQGSSFALYFPVSSNLVSHAKELPGQQLKRRGPAHILLIEDEAMIRQMAVECLSSLDYKVNTCSNGREAVAFYRENWNQIDLILLDMIMPEMGGRETYLQLRAINPKLKVILASGYSLNGEAQQILADGVQGFIQKPFRISDLAHQINALLEIP
jgi:PAS domain S-box-containing protein